MINFVSKSNVEALVVRSAEYAADAISMVYQRNAAIAVDTYAVDAKKEVVLRSLLFIDSPIWKGQLKLLVDEFNAAVTTCNNTIERERNTLLQHVAEINSANADRRANSSQLVIDTTDHLRARLLTLSSRINDAATAAIGGSDGGEALRQLAAEVDPPLFNILENDILKTAAIATDTRLSRAQVYIGMHCNTLEAKGVIGIRQQWLQIYHNLKKLTTRQLADDHDAGAAWEFFQGWQPLDLKGKHAEAFNKLISSYKQEMKKRTSLSQSDDKVTKVSS